MKIEKYIKEKDIKKRIKELGKTITNDYKGKELVILSILKGSFMFTADLIRELDILPIIDFIKLESYGCNTISSGEVKRINDITIDVKGRDVLIIEDIADTGTTVNYIIDYLKSKGAKSSKVCVLLNKKDSHNMDLQIDYYGFIIENKFVVGYGLDYDQKYRNLPYIGILEKE
ncbi:hypoxanthine phosphoribosyltransferase [candidate division WOR-3 bacterium]|jgi:hypoxanthine phosphoribosyltransferase|nr:hypoxanthine phosphoribosyltransferase [candidate division WOR-3 bacterium]